MKNNLEKFDSGEECVVVKVQGHGEFRHRILELGFVQGQKITVIKNAPLMDPVEYQILDTRISLRRSEARQIEVMSVSEYEKLNHQNTYNGLKEVQTSVNEREHSNPTRTINVALVGNPNCGKTTLFNKITKAKEKTGNYAGVTVGEKIASIHRDGYTINLIDLPGTYSITEYSKEEAFVRNYILNQHPDIILNIVDVNNLERNLFLTTQLIDMNVKTIMSLNMYDELERNGSSLDYKSLAAMLGFPIIPTVATKGEGVEDIFNAIINVFEEKENLRHFHINYGDVIEKAISHIESELDLNKDLAAKFHTRYLAIKLLETNEDIKNIIPDVANDNKKNKSKYSFKRAKEAIIVGRSVLELEYRDDARAVITSAKYGFIRGALAETYTSRISHHLETSSNIDKVLTNKYFGIPLLLAFIWLMFQTTFTIGSYPADWLDMLVGFIGDKVADILPEGIFHDLVVDGIIAGVGSVIVFVPNIMILFLFMAFMEGSGYMARAAFIMDRLMHKIGLHGKSFIPLLMGFGCNVPAIMATRTLASKKDRIITMLLIPFMSCSARLPVYILIISLFFERNQGLILMGIYMVGVIIAVIVSLVLDRTIKVESEAPFVMELPTYRMPSFKVVLRDAMIKVNQYIKKMGTTILAFSVVIWALGYFPTHSDDMSAADKLENSYIGTIGKVIEPAIEPLGFNWKMGVCLISGVGAKEVVVSTLGVLYGAEDGESEDDIIASSRIKQNILNDTFRDGHRVGERVFTPVVAISFMAFILLYVPCFAVVIAIYKEGGRKWACISVTMSIAIAWGVAFLITTIGNLI